MTEISRMVANWDQFNKAKLLSAQQLRKAFEQKRPVFELDKAVADKIQRLINIHKERSLGGP